MRSVGYLQPNPSLFLERHAALLPSVVFSSRDLAELTLNVIPGKRLQNHFISSLINACQALMSFEWRDLEETLNKTLDS